MWLYARCMCIQTEQEGSAHLEYPRDLLSLSSVHVSLGDRPHMEQFAAVDGRNRQISPSRGTDCCRITQIKQSGQNQLLWALWVNIPVLTVFIMKKMVVNSTTTPLKR